MSVLLETTLGELVIDLEVTRVPENAKNFLHLAIMKRFNNLAVSTIDENFICVFGESGREADAGSAEFQITGGKKFLASEKHERVKHSKQGTVGMVNNGESFYITLRDGALEHLDKTEMTIIGYVEEGQEVLDKINATLCDNQKRPFNPIRVRHAVVLDEDAGSHPAWFPRDLPESPLEILDAKLEAEEELDERVLREREREALARAQEVELELMGDLPSADLKPPNNVLFVCQLNPVTQDEDLKTVFARFGEIEKSEIIRDFKTGDSLQYAFVEFKKEDSCNKAYVAMQNVLVDDRRIKVDFSQSVSKMWNQYRRQGVKQAWQPQPHRDKPDEKRRDRSVSRDRRDQRRRSRSYDRSRRDGDRDRGHRRDDRQHIGHEERRDYDGDRRSDNRSGRRY